MVWDGPENGRKVGERENDLGKVGKGRKKIGRGGPERGVKAIVGEGDGDCEKLRKWERNETEALKNGLGKEKGSKNRKVVQDGPENGRTGWKARERENWLGRWDREGTKTGRGRWVREKIREGPERGVKVRVVREGDGDREQIG